MKKHLFIGLLVVMAAALLGCEAVYEDYPPPPPPAPPAVAPQPQADPFIVIDDPDWEANQTPSGYGNVPPGTMYGNQMAPQYSQQPMMYPGQGNQVIMTPPGQQPMMVPPDQQQMMYQGQQQMMYPGQQQMMYPGQQQMMMEPGQDAIMFDPDSQEPPGVIYETPGGPGQEPIIYPQGEYVPE